ncbi:GrpB family protein [Serratia marcescens]|uniref:GrpB family protein n=1 Tax=Serratia marcescens TaxID=615 RepID=UPI0023807088|nr:GrpB family protein [Serratia marcescens]
MSARIITIPTIDILLEVESLPALDSLNDRMRDMGYTPRSENGIAGRRYDIKGNGKRTHHVHAFIAGSEQAIGYLAFRDYLRKHYDVLSNTGQSNTKQQKAAGKIQRLMAG